MTASRSRYSGEELAWIEARRDWPRADLHRAFSARFQRTDVSADTLRCLCKRKGWLTGRTGCFPKGGRAGIANPRYKPIGSERVSPDGYLERKVHDGQPMHARWRRVHVIEWEKINGHVPDGFCLKALDGDKTNTNPANWRLIPVGMRTALNGGRMKRRPAYDEAAPELRPSLLAIAEIEEAARKIRRTAA